MISIRIRTRKKKPLSNCLTWDDSYAIAQAQNWENPEVNLEGALLNLIFLWTVALPDFRDDPELANDLNLEAI